MQTANLLWPFTACLGKLNPTLKFDTSSFNLLVPCNSVDEQVAESECKSKSQERQNVVYSFRSKYID